jgi:hypothetical protein
MKRWPTMMLAALAAVGLARGAQAADPWEGGSGDDDPGTVVNALGHGSVQTHDLQAQGGMADLDWIRIPQVKGRSYEVRLGGTAVPFGTGECSECARFQRVGGDGTVLQNGDDVLNPATVTQASNERTLRWIAAEDTTDEYVRITGQSGFSSSSVYTVRFWETTLVAPGATACCPAFQLHPVVLSNLTPRTASVVVFAYVASTREPISRGTFTLRAFASLGSSVWDTNIVQTSPWYVAHTAGYGGLAARIRPDGDTLDTPFQSIPH